MDRRAARNWYWWLWLSPLLTIPTLSLVIGMDPGYIWFCAGRLSRCNWALAERVTVVVAILVSGLWHLVLLRPSLKTEVPFVRWHGRQALLLAGARTALPFLVGLVLGESLAILLFLPVQLALWFGGTLWGQRQAARGDCSLMRWLGQGELLASLQRADPTTQVAAMDPDALVDLFRHSHDPEQRRAALRELERKRMVESL